MQFSKIWNDPSGYFFHHTRKKYQLVSTLLDSWVFRFILLIKNVPHGKGVKTHGHTYINRRPLSQIILGDHVVFRSSIRSNLVGINRPCMVSTLSSKAVIQIGSGCGLSGTVIGAAEKIVLGRNVLVGANTLITDTDWHNIQPELRRIPCQTSMPVTIDDNVWLGINTVVLKGVHIGKNSIIAANSVVVKNIPANVIAGGNPCRVIKELECLKVPSAEADGN